MEVIGIDIGFGFTKATNGKKTAIFKSIYGDATDLQFWMDLGSQSGSDFYNVTIDGKSYFIGDLAEQQSNVLNFTLDQEKLITEFVKILALTAAGLFMKNKSAVNIPLNIVSGLPIGYFKNNHDRFNDILTGHHQITYHRPNGKNIVKEIYVNKLRMLPQPLGSVLNLLMDDSGNIINSDLTRQKIGVVDIGFRTTDFTIMERLRYIDRGSRTMDTGISKAFGIISEKLREKCGTGVQLYRLYNAVESGMIMMKGRGLDFSQVRNQVYSQLAANIANDIDRLWTEDWDIDTILLTGGGSMVLAEYLEPLIGGNVQPLINDVDARLNNVMGYLKYGRYIWGDTGAEYNRENRNKPSEAAPPVPVEAVMTKDNDAPYHETADEDLLIDEEAIEELEELADESITEDHRLAAGGAFN